MIDDVQKKRLSAFVIMVRVCELPKWSDSFGTSHTWTHIMLKVIFLDVSWSQATLLVRWGGLGVKSIVDLAPSAFLASFCLVRPLIL